jgi:hypothetical protein
MRAAPLELLADALLSRTGSAVAAAYDALD